MLQQTQVNRVIPKYESWLRSFPTVHELAKASVADVLFHWSGLGYNRRALNLKKTAQIIDENYRGKFPSDEKELLSLPGIGQYTARAIMCFAFDQQVAVVDINVKKVILTQIIKQSALRLGDTSFEEKVSDKEISSIAEMLVPIGKAYDWNQALMDYSSLMLKSERIKIPKQSAFKGSNRYYRGKILKVLLLKKEIGIKDLGKQIKDDFSKLDSDWLKILIQEMEKEGFIETKKEHVYLKQ